MLKLEILKVVDTIFAENRWRIILNCVSMIMPIYLEHFFVELLWKEENTTLSNL